MSFNGKLTKPTKPNHPYKVTLRRKEKEIICKECNEHDLTFQKLTLKKLDTFIKNCNQND